MKIKDIGTWLITCIFCYGIIYGVVTGVTGQYYNQDDILQFTLLFGIAVIVATIVTAAVIIVRKINNIINSI